MGEIGRRYPVDREKTTVHSISDRLLCDKLDKTERTWNGIVPCSQEIRDAMPTRRTRCRTRGGGHLKRSPFFLGSSRGRTTCRTVSVGPRRRARRRRRNGKIEQSVGVPVDNQRKCFFSPPRILLYFVQYVIPQPYGGVRAVYGGCTGVTGKRRYGRKDSSVRKEARKRASRSRNGNRTAHRIDSVTVSAAVSTISYRHDAACRAFSDSGACGNGARTACFLRAAPLRKRFVTRRCDVLSFRRSVPCGRTARRNVR